ncbi:unnamed protein product [Caretta caretta]
MAVAGPGWLALYTRLKALLVVINIPCGGGGAEACSVGFGWGSGLLPGPGSPAIGSGLPGAPGQGPTCGFGEGRQLVSLRSALGMVLLPKKTPGWAHGTCTAQRSQTQLSCSLVPPAPRPPCPAELITQPCAGLHCRPRSGVRRAVRNPPP